MGYKCGIHRDTKLTYTSPAAIVFMNLSFSYFIIYYIIIITKNFIAVKFNYFAQVLFDKDENFWYNNLRKRGVNQ